MTEEVTETKEKEKEIEVIELTDTSNRLPVARVVEDVMQLLERDENIAKIIYYKLKQKYNETAVS